MGLRYVSDECRDALVDHFFRCCPVALCYRDAEAFFNALCRIIDREIARAIEAEKPAEKGPS